MSQQAKSVDEGTAEASLMRSIVQLARQASIEINVQDVKHLDVSKKFLPPGKKLYVSHLPKQSWRDTQTACNAVSAAGFEPIPHIPVRLMADATTLDGVLSDLVEDAQVQEVLLIAGDYPQPLGPYSTVADVLHSGLLNQHGIRRISVAGHPEGHPNVTLDMIRHAEYEKAMLATQMGLDVTFLTQFFFEHAPFLEWARELRDRGVGARIVGGLAGPASIATLFKFALRCGVGPSIKALGVRPASLLKLIGDHGPEQVLLGLADAYSREKADFTGIHLFCFGGYLRTCEWLSAVANGGLTVTDDTFEVPSK